MQPSTTQRGVPNSTNVTGQIDNHHSSTHNRINDYHQTAIDNSNNNRNNFSSKVNRQDLPLSEVDPKAARQKSTEEKLQLWGTIQTMQREGKMPHNGQLDELLEKLQSNKVISSREHLMSEDGRVLLHDFRKLIGTIRRALAEKNQDELFQSLVYHLHCMESPIKKEHLKQDSGGVSDGTRTPSGQSTAQTEGKKASEALYRVGKLILINNEFRSVLGDLIDISQDIFSNVAGKAGESFKKAGSNIEDSGDTGKSGKHYVDRALDAALSHTENRYDSSDHSQQPHLIDVPPSDHRHQGLLSTGDSVHPNALPGAFPQDQEQFNHAKSRANEKVKEHPTYQKARDQYDEHKRFAQDTVKEKIPEEKQDELLSRLKSALSEIQKNPDYQEAISTLFHLLDVWSTRLSKVSQNVVNKAKENDRPEQMDYREQAERELKTIIETWAQGYSIDPLLQGVQNVIKDAREDDKLREYYDRVKNYLHRLMKEPGYAADDRSTDDGRRLMDERDRIVKGRYKDHLDYLSSESRKYMNLMAEDEVAKELHSRLAKIHRDLWRDREGNPAFKPHLLNDMRLTLLPAFIDEIKYIPIPRIEYSDAQYDIAIENLVISGDTLLPNIFETKIDSYNNFSLRAEVPSQPSHQTLFVRMSEIQADINDVVFYYKKKTGFPKISDRGVASVAVGGKGITITVKIASVAENPAKTFKVAVCKCNVDNLSLKVNDSKHDILYKTIRPLVIGQIRKQIAKGIELKLTELLNQADQRITRTLVRMNQDLQNRAYEALPESEKAQTRPPVVSQARHRPGFLSTLVSVANHNIRNKVQQRNEAKRWSRLSQDSGSLALSRNQNDEKRQVNSPTGNRPFSQQHQLSSPAAMVERMAHDTHPTSGQPPAIAQQQHYDVMARPEDRSNNRDTFHDVHSTTGQPPALLQEQNYDQTAHPEDRPSNRDTFHDVHSTTGQPPALLQEQNYDQTARPRDKVIPDPRRHKDMLHGMNQDAHPTSGQPPAIAQEQHYHTGHSGKSDFNPSRDIAVNNNHNHGQGHHDSTIANHPMYSSSHQPTLGQPPAIAQEQHYQPAQSSPAQNANSQAYKQQHYGTQDINNDQLHNAAFGQQPRALPQQQHFAKQPQSMGINTEFPSRHHQGQPPAFERDKQPYYEMPGKRLDSPPRSPTNKNFNNTAYCKIANDLAEAQQAYEQGAVHTTPGRH
ncbi:hypothetical protein BDF20DRAFT_838111 [Mycotypha africana]|uniref:uncharacterized protein n=1 Tax=Mycotypha africana TaxID=64632 RepID=UPI0023003559|nr:uncharacterized protein BDF20DRAFT_838111 [Mycotypha africana]KAI8971829.1 hypothetical protein BDF20DRAFT_838111 [Mycotypha africana]